MKSFSIAVIAFFLSGHLFAAELGDDGLHKQPWFEQTFKDIQEDIDDARDAGKRLAILFEQRGCPYCEKMHKTVYVDPDVVAYIEEHFLVVQYNLYGSEEVTDTDGEVLSERDAARKWKLHYTPSLLFLPETANTELSAIAQTVAQLPGAASVERTSSMLHWVVEKAYLGSQSFEDFHQSRVGS